MAKFYQDQNVIKHFGILGMHWGHRKASGGNISDSKLFKATVINKDTSLFTAKGRAAAKQDVKNVVSKAKEIGGKITDNKAFKTFVVDKTDVTGLIFRKSEVQKLKNFFSSRGTALKTGMEKWSVNSQDKEIKQARELATSLKKSQSPKDHALAKKQEDWANELEKDLNEVFTPEELKKYRGE